MSGFAYLIITPRIESQTFNRVVNKRITKSLTPTPLLWANVEGPKNSEKFLIELRVPGLLVTAR